MIDPATLLHQRRVLAGSEAPREIPEPRLRLVRNSTRKPGSGKRPTCLCGECRKCKNRQWMAERRAGTFSRESRRPRCAVCGGGRYGSDPAGWCCRCQQCAPASHRKALGQTFTDAGGI